MDIYKIDNKEGSYIARELENLRCKKKRGKIAVRCNRINNSQVYRFRSLLLLEKGTTNIFNEALNYYITIADDGISLNIVYSDCDIIYYLGGSSDWKIIDLEIDDKEFRDEISHNQDKIASRADAISFLAIFTYAYTYGYDNVFLIKNSKELYDVIADLIEQNEISEIEFGIDAKIINIISQHTMKPVFVENFFNK